MWHPIPITHHPSSSFRSFLPPTTIPQGGRRGCDAWDDGLPFTMFSHVHTEQEWMEGKLYWLSLWECFCSSSGEKEHRYEKYHELAAGFPPGLGGITYGRRPIIISYPYTTFYWRHTLRCIGIPQEDEEAQEADEEKHYYYFIPVLRIHLNTDLDSCSTLTPIPKVHRGN